MVQVQILCTGRYSMIKVGINGYGTIGRRVADAVQAQSDMTVVGIVKNKPDYVALEASKMYRVFCVNKASESDFVEAGIQTHGEVEDLVNDADIIVDATPEGQGQKNLDLYRKSGKKAIFQGGESAHMVEASFNAYSNYVDAWGKDAVRVVSCNTTAMARTVSAVGKAFGALKVDATIIRRATDPNDSKKGPINAVEPSLAFPSHHGPDLKTVMEIGQVNTVALKVPTTLMHVHAVKVTTEKGLSQEDVTGVFKGYNRILYVSGKLGVTSTAQIMDMARERGRKRGDLFEIAVWKESIHVEGNSIRYIQAVHQESDVVPENVDAIRSMMQSKEGDESIKETDRSMKLGVN